MAFSDVTHTQKAKTDDSGSRKRNPSLFAIVGEQTQGPYPSLIVRAAIASTK